MRCYLILLFVVVIVAVIQATPVPSEDAASSADNRKKLSKYQTAGL